MKKKPLLNFKKPRNRLQPQSFIRLLPNMATVMATCAGLTSIRFALMNNYALAVAALIIAAILDTMDGKLARLLGASSDFGAELDSLSDFVSFGVAPPLIIYNLIMHEWRGLGWGICLFFAVCMSLRLARFNVMSREPIQPSWSSKFFTGVPAPAGAMIGIFPIILDLATDLHVFKTPTIYAFFLIISGILMISRLPTFSIKSISIPTSLSLPLMVILGLWVTCLMNALWETLSVTIFLYILSIPVACLYFKRMMAETVNTETT